MMEEYIAILPARAHEEGEEEGLTAADYGGPILALFILVAAIMIAQRLKKS